MAYQCCVADCNNTSERQPAGCGKYYEGKFVKFPKSPTLRNKWLEALKLSDEQKASVSRQLVCAAHFGAEAWRLQDVIMNVPLAKRRLKPDAVPLPRCAASATVTGKGQGNTEDAPDVAAMDKARRKQLVAEALAAYEQSEGKNLTPNSRMPQRRRRAQVASRTSSRQFEKIALAASKPKAKGAAERPRTEFVAAHSSEAEMEVPLAGLNVFATHRTKKCGEIVVDIDEQNFVLNCFLCTTTCRELAAFVEHIKVRHASLLNAPAKCDEVKSLSPEETEEPEVTSNAKALQKQQTISAPAQSNNSKQLSNVDAEYLDFSNVPLIEHILCLYKQNPVLWNRTHPQHGIFRQRKTAIVGILQNLNERFPQISAAYKSLSNLLLRLRAAYRADLRHIEAPGRPPPNHWFFDKMREFLGEETRSEQNLNDPAYGKIPLVVHKCSYCGKRFPKAPNLKRHLRLHTNERPYACKLCGAQFRNYSTWFRHGRTHTKLKPYRCNDCERCYYTPSMLRLHQKSHLGIRDKVCDICGKAFTQAKYLYRHCAEHRKRANNEERNGDKRKRGGKSKQQAPNTLETPSTASTNQVATIVKIDKQQVEKSSDAYLPPVEDILQNLNIKGLSFVQNYI